MSIFLAEDDPELRESLARALEADGATVDCAVDGDVAVARLLDASYRPDVIVSDVRMPGTTGIEVLRRARGAGITTPVILMTGFGQLGDLDLDGFGATILLEKPFDFDDLRTALHNLSRISSLRPRAEAR